ncbi:MAG: alanine racemase [Euryarchaeota archaeon]|nr:alanine racemase [Euryarchaeota archaeon]
MHVKDLPTPLILLDVEKLKRNISKVSRIAMKNSKKIWPMIKTHKSTYIARLQRDYGSDGFLCGTIDEAEVLTEKGLTKNIMIAYPIADRENLRRVMNIIEEGVRVIIRVDSKECAEFINDHLRKRGLDIDYVVKVDVGMKRLGVSPEKIGKFVSSVEKYKRLNFVGVVTHPGQAYASTSPDGVKEVAETTAGILREVKKEIERLGYDPEIVGTGSTPTLRYDLEMDVYTHLFPGNYVYYDRFQVEFMGSATFNDCALTVLATVISIPEHSKGKLAVINVGSKYLGLDRAAHGGEALKNYGYIIEHPKARIFALSEEVGKVDISEDQSVRIGEKVTIIPNHACVVGNATSYLVAHVNGIVKGLVEVDMRNGVRVPRTILNVQLNK